MSKVPNTAPIKAPVIEPRDADAEHNIEKLVRSDREKLSSFVDNLNKGVSFDEMDEDLKSWWMTRY